MSKLTKSGYQDLIEVLSDYFDIQVDREFIDKHIKVFEDEFIEQDGLYMEANSGGVFDTYVRDILGDVLAKIFVGDDYHWPLYADSTQYTDAFFTKYKKNVLASGLKGAE